MSHQHDLKHSVRMLCGDGRTTKRLREVGQHSLLGSAATNIDRLKRIKKLLQHQNCFSVKVSALCAPS